MSIKRMRGYGLASILLRLILSLRSFHHHKFLLANDGLSSTPITLLLAWVLERRLML
jgi:hypothetical protein